MLFFICLVRSEEATMVIDNAQQIALNQSALVKLRIYQWRDLLAVFLLCVLEYTERLETGKLPNHPVIYLFAQRYTKDKVLFMN